MKTMAHYTNNMKTKLDLPELEYPYSWKVAEGRHAAEADRDKSFLYITLMRDRSSKLRSLAMSIFSNISPNEGTEGSKLVGIFTADTSEEEIRTALENEAANMYKRAFPEPVPLLPPSPFAGDYIPDLF